MDNVNEEKIAVTAEPAGAEITEAAAGLGKFKSVDALIKAYSELEAEFTRRSQRLKELEEGNKARADVGAPSPGKEDSESRINAVMGDETVRDAVIGDYLKNMSENRGVPLIVNGERVAAPEAKPKSVKEAGALAARFLKI